MKKTIRKVFPSWNFDKEENWLNEMSSKGLQLCEVGYCRYVFEYGEPNAFIYRIELQKDYMNDAKTEQYAQLMADFGIEKAGEVFGWAYFKKKADANGFELFSDVSSRISYFNRILVLFGVLLGFNLLGSYFNFSVAFTGDNNFTAYINLTSGIICSIACLPLTYGLIRVNCKRHKLEKENVIRE